jgi:hypothetical protein
MLKCSYVQLSVTLNYIKSLYVSVMEGVGILDSPAIEIEAICKKILRETTLDVFYLISNEKDISKSEIAHRFQEDDGGEGKSQRYRFKINEALAKLEGAMFIDSWTDGTQGAPSRYFLTTHGEWAQKILDYMFEEEKYDPMILKGSKIVSKLMNEGDE